MNTLAESVPEAAPEVQAAAAAAIHPVRPFLWSVRRELWETRSIYVAPLIAAGVFLFGCLVSARRLGPWLHHHMDASAQSRAAAAYAPPFFGDFVILGTALVVAVFYCLGALHNERRDRSILFWKSLPVSDLTAVAAKAAIPLVVLPVISLAIALVTHLIVVGLDTAVLASAGVAHQGAMQLPVLQQLGMLIYGVFTLTLWHAPAYAWFLLVSVWARRAPFLWAFGLPIAATIFETVAFGTSVVGSFFWKRLMGGLDQAFSATHHGPGEITLPQIDLLGFFGNPGLWIGLVVAAAMLAGCVWLRRYREPV
jgi:ABC-2 type transport system permease protein